VVYNKMKEKKDIETIRQERLEKGRCPDCNEILDEKHLGVTCTAPFPVYLLKDYEEQ